MSQVKDREAGKSGLVSSPTAFCLVESATGTTRVCGALKPRISGDAHTVTPSPTPASERSAARLRGSGLENLSYMNLIHEQNPQMLRVRA